ncbi:MAG TPA: ATP-binding cassette domain-containing protein, partial [Ramlibacter sp.]|uniref:ATP-binding cassette domain-containing protein n=1 Tax=Ramlibacter sp. TaxID=1917967 RepID=UPI002D7E24FC
MASALLRLQGVSKSFGGLAAVQEVSLELPAGSLAALIGPNGAGKTTLFALASGFLRPDAGSIAFDGEEITGAPPHLNARRGMTRTFQVV